MICHKIIQVVWSCIGALDFVPEVLDTILRVDGIFCASYIIHIF